MAVWSGFGKLCGLRCHKQLIHDFCCKIYAVLSNFEQTADKAAGTIMFFLWIKIDII